MKRLRTLRFRYWVMPVILAALAARAFMPAGFMSSAGEDGMAATIAMCSQDKTRRERIEFPGEKSPGEHRLQCKHCLAPVLGAPFAFYDSAAPAAVLAEAGVRVGHDYPAPIVEHALARQRFIEIARKHLG